MTLPDALELRAVLPDEYQRRSRRAMAAHVRAMLAFQRAGAVVFDYGNNLRAQALEAGVPDAFDYPGFVPAFIRPQFCEGRGPFRWTARSGDPAEIARTDRTARELFPTTRRTAGSRWPRSVPFQGLPRHLLARLRRAAKPDWSTSCPGLASRCADRHRAGPPRRRIRRPRTARPRAMADFS
jgi:urocanate hydratase